MSNESTLNPISQIPTPDEVRESLSRNLKEHELLQKLLRLAERKQKLQPREAAPCK